MKLILRTLLTMSLSGVLLLLFFHVKGKVDGVRVGYELADSLKKKDALTQKNERLQAQFSQLTSPERIASEAREKLGMKPPHEGQVVLVSSSPGNGKPSDGPEPPLRLARQTSD